MTTFGRFTKLIPLNDERADAVISAPTPEEGNQLILNICVVGVNKDKTLMEFCYLVEKLVDNPKLSTIMKVFKNGRSL